MCTRLYKINKYHDIKRSSYIYKHVTLRDEKTFLPLSVRGAYKATTAPYQTIWCSYFSFIHSLTPDVSGQVALAALVALIALVIYHLTIHTRDPPLLSPRISQPDSIPRQSAQARILATDTTCSGYKHVTLRDEKTSLPLSVIGAYKATTAPYQTIWCSYVWQPWWLYIYILYSIFCKYIKMTIIG